MGSAAFAQDTASAPTTAPSRPAIGTYRWQEDWSFLADPSRRTEPGDALKYIPLSHDDQERYLSFGVTLRERYEYNNAPQLGVAGRGGIDYLIHRLELHADAHIGTHMRLFMQVENALAPGLKNPGPADANKLDLRLAFVDGNFAAGDGLVKWRLGRQEMAFDLQRFISVRDGPNVRQAYDAAWGDYEQGDWRFSGFVSQPVQYRSTTAFDDFSNGHRMYGGVRVQRQNIAGGEISATFSGYRNDNARFPAGAGKERRRNLDVRWVGTAHGFDWDVEGMRQGGSLGATSVEAWAIGTRVGYTLSSVPWMPRLGVQLDAASGDRDPHDGRIGTFNPMFPNGYYVTLSGYTGYSNFIHAKPSLALRPVPRVNVLAALGALWRQTTHDAVFAQPSVALPGTAGGPGRRTAEYAELRIDWSASRNVALAFEADRYHIARIVRDAGGHDSSYVGAEVRWGW